MKSSQKYNFIFSQFAQFKRKWMSGFNRENLSVYANLELRTKLPRN